ncbi:MAG: hypothetical protein ABIN48_10780 [Ginsengibacter sp.]
MLLLSIAGICSFKSAWAQGGPPMLTDDPAVVGFHSWEINSSINSTITNKTQLAVPYIDINYGAFRNFHVNIESAFLLTYNKQGPSSGALGDVIVAVKYHFLKEGESIISAGTYPRLTLTGEERGFLLPLSLEKTIGRFIIGEDFGIFFGENNNRSLQNGILLGYNVSDRIQVMGEYFVEIEYKPALETSGFMNYGFTIRLNKTFTLIGSLGKQILTPSNEEKVRFISFLGVRSDF